MNQRVQVLVVEDGNEYLELLERFVTDYRYLQAHSGAEALQHLRNGNISLIYLDMCFDRTPRGELLGDVATIAPRHGGDDERAWRFIARNQGLFILDRLKRDGFGHLPVLLSHDFSSQPTRWMHLKGLYPQLAWVPDDITPQEISTRIKNALI